ncbi:MAG TPA: pitrilysin family protein [Vicinamibacterales bacterium]|nr:pitrilysin family protein [Vicinamibacterales bacterium]
MNLQRNTIAGVMPVLLTVTLAVPTFAKAPAGKQAPQAPPATAMVLKGKAPISSEILKVKLPKPQTATLPNGLQIMVVENRTLPQVSFQLIIPGAGGYYDPADKIGLAQYTAQMMREGTKTRNTLQMAQELETMAANMGVSAGLSSQNATVSGGSLTENFDKVFEIALDVLMNPTFPAEEWERAKARAKSGLVQQRTNPGFLSTERYNKILYGDHPAGRASVTAAGLDAITRDAMVEFHRAHYVPDHALIAFAGDISLAEARKKVEAGLGAWKKAGVPKPTVTEPAAPGAPKVTLIARPASVQTSLRVGGPSMTRKDADYEALTVANRVLGGTMGRLFRHLREEKGYTYGIGSSFSALSYRGDWSASTSVRTAVTEAALTDLLAEIAEMRDKPVPTSEFEDSKRALQASFALSLENPAAILSYYVQSWTYDLPADYWDTYPARIAAITVEQAQAATRKYWDPARLHIVAVGDAPAISAALAKKGTLEVFDADGKPLPAK